MSINKYTVIEANNISLGQLGFDVITEGASATSGNFVAVKALNGDVRLTTTTSIGDVLSNATIDSGDIVYGVFTSVEYDAGDGAGTMIAYRG